jgi:3-dehydroquinate synthetase
LNHSITHTISVPIATGSYPIYLGTGLLEGLGAQCRSLGVPRSIVLLADRNSARAALRRAVRSLEAEGFAVSTIVIPPGERQKNLARAGAILSSMLKMGVPRASAMIALGGGVVGDLAGFVASVYRRGMEFIQCPTTLLAVADSSVGGKNGVNHPVRKNAIGTFKQPLFVMSDVSVLSTLPRREMISGFGEILKYPVVGEPGLLSYIEEHLDAVIQRSADHLIEICSRCLRIKSSLVAEDERELLTDRGRVFLNVGHAVGHVLEKESRYRLRHGEAVLLGILAEGRIAVLKEGFPPHELDRFVTIYRRLGCSYDLRAIRNAELQKTLLRADAPRFVLPRKLGSVVVVGDVTSGQLIEGMRFIRAL